MNEKNLYLLGVLALVWAVSYLLRALPFLLFGTGKKPAPVIGYIGRVLTPAVIAMLTVYCFAGYVKSGCLGTSLHGLAEVFAAAVTVALHLWRRNPLLSIACGTAVYMLLVR
ncbi:MAG: AzlD domain-containing protein [Kiritimatiellae bacterium]|nr:AzlD domain-containing protein [Kiritimatiellia bacterium]